MEYLDPRKQPNKWLEAMLMRLLDNAITKNDKESLELIKYAHRQLTIWIEPGVLQLFSSSITQSGCFLLPSPWISFL